MKRNFILSLVFVLFATSCSPIYETRHNYIAPTNQQGIACISNCSMNKHSCIGQCNSQRHSCLILEESRARTDYEDYLRTSCSEVTTTHSIGHIPSIQPIHTNSAYSNKRLNCQHNRTPDSFRRTEHCNSSFESCSHGCSHIYNECYIGCGGQIEEHKVCIAFCERG